MASIPFDPVTPLTHAIDGVIPREVVTPESGQELADVLAEAAATGKVVAAVGGRSKLALGNVPEQLDIAVSTARLSGIISYEPTDLTLSVWAGSRFQEVTDHLAAQGQSLPIDVSSKPDATIGGLIATGLSGPRRSGSPTFRDLLIGISAAHPNGTVTKAGGMVVKNVTGFDLMRLYLGSLGTLGVIVSANFKILPLARFEATAIATYSSLTDATEAGLRALQVRGRPVALEVFSAGAEWKVAIRLEGRESTVELLIEEAKALLRAETETVQASASQAWWQSSADREAPNTNGSDAVLRATTRPRAGGALIENVAKSIIEHNASAELVSWAPVNGSVTARVSFANSAHPDTDFKMLRGSLLTVADNVTVLAAPPAWKDDIDVWGKPPETLDIMRALKLEFDPERVLNRGRFAGGI